MQECLEIKSGLAPEVFHVEPHTCGKLPARDRCPVCGKPADRFEGWLCCGYDCYMFLRECYE